MTAPALATRVMHARRESLCPVCMEPIRVGDLIGKAGMWQHIRHITGHQHQEDATLPTPADVADVLSRPQPQRPARTSRTPQPFHVARLGNRVTVVRDGQPQDVSVRLGQSS